MQDIDHLPINTVLDKPRNSSKIITFVNIAIVVIFLLLISNALIFPLIFSYNIAAIDNSPLVKIIKYLPFLLFIFFNPYILFKIRIKSHIDKVIILIFLFYLISSTWSPAPLSTLINSFQFGIFILFCYYLTRIRHFELLRSIRFYLIIIVIFSYVFYYLLPEFGRMHGFHEGLARGVFMQKNNLGSVLVALLPTTLTNYKKQRSYLLTSLALGLIYISGSTTSTLVAILLIASSLIIGKFNNKSIIIFLLLLFLGLAYIYLVYFSQILLYFGKSQDLTGRITLWENISEAISKKPILGYGYWGFWNSSIKMNTFAEMEWVTGKSHNAFLDVLLSGGISLLIIFILLILISFKNILSITQLDKRNFSILTFLAVLALSFTEIGLLEHNSIFFFMLYLINKID